MEFLKSNQIELNAANYLISKESGNPVTHNEFIAQQKAAEYVVKLAEAIKGKTFKANKVADLNAIKKEVMDSITQTSKISYVETPVKPSSKIQDELVQFALDFVKYNEKKDKVEVVNDIMNNYNKINDVEKVGEYFSEGLVKLNKIYTIKEILKAVKETSEVLD